MKALIVHGGWDGHEPVKVAEFYREFLTKQGFEVVVSGSLDAYTDAAAMGNVDLILQHVTMSKIAKEQAQALRKAVRDEGVGLAGIHGGLCDSFREDTEYQLMTGGQWVAHPGNIIDYRVHIVDHADEVTAGLDHFNMHSEQYYMHVDPGNHVLATTTFEYNGVTMPVAWKRMYGKGRVFYSSLGHVRADLDVPQAATIIQRGMLWAAQSRKAAGLK
jgi:type 1 glutamine amidotransferase